MLLAQREALSTNPLNKELANSVEFAEKLKTRLQNARDGNLEDNESADKLIFLLDRAVIFTIKQVPIVIFETPVLEGTKSSPTLILPEVSQPLIEKKVKLPKTNDIIFIKGLIISEFPNDISSEHQMADKSPTNEKEDQEIRSVDLYMDEIAKYPLLNLEGEKILGEKIFKAKLSLRTLKSLTDYLPIEEQTKVNTLVSKGRGKIIFDVLLSEISGKKDSIEEKTKIGEVVPDDEIVFMEKVNENSQSIEQQAEGLLSIKDKTTQEQKALEFAKKEIILFNEGNEAFEQFCNSNLRLVVSIAKKYHPSRLGLMDLIQDGNEGLMKAVARFDYRQGFKFSTYASWWIRQSIQRGIKDNDLIIRLPVHISDTLSFLQKERQKIQQEEGRPIRITEVAERLKIEPKNVKSAVYSKTIISLDNPLNNQLEDSGTLGDFIVDPDVDVVYEASIDETKKQVRDTLTQLTDRERRVLELRFGLIDGRERTLEETGEEIGVTRERVRQIQLKTIRKLRRLGRSSGLRDLL